MKFTTNLERYLFAKVCQANANKMWKFSLEKRNKSRKDSKKYKFWDEGFKKNLHKSNFWSDVAAYYEDAAFKGIPETLRMKLSCNGMIPTKEEV